MRPYAKFGLDRPSRSAGHWQQTDRQINKHIAFYYVDVVIIKGESRDNWLTWFSWKIAVKQCLCCPKAITK